MIIKTELKKITDPSGLHPTCVLTCIVHCLRTALKWPAECLGYGLLSSQVNEVMNFLVPGL